MEKIELIKNKIIKIYPKTGKIYFYGPKLIVEVETNDILNFELASKISKVCKYRCQLVSKPNNLLSLTELKKKLAATYPNITYGTHESHGILNLNSEIPKQDLEDITKNTGWILITNGKIHSKIRKIVMLNDIKNNHIKSKNMLRFGGAMTKINNAIRAHTTIRVLGSGREVGRSMYYITTPKYKIILDAGIKLGSTIEFPMITDAEISMAQVDAIIITHGHADHCMFLPHLYVMGYRGPIYMTEPTKDLVYYLHMDGLKIGRAAGNIMPYTVSDILNLQAQILTINYQKPTTILPGVTTTFYSARHILGSAMVYLQIANLKILFTGDYHPKNHGELPAVPIKKISCRKYDVIISQATYGVTKHSMDRATATTELTDLICSTFKNGGTCLIPCFAIGRPNLILPAIISAAEKSSGIQIVLDGSIPELLKLHMDHKKYLGKNIDNFSNFLKRCKENNGAEIEAPSVILSPSGMLSGSSVKHYARLASNSKNTMALVGYQAPGTPGYALVNGATEVVVKINNEPVVTRPKLKIKQFGGFSGHADHDGLVSFLKHLKTQNLYVVHSDSTRVVKFVKVIKKIKGIKNAYAIKNLETIRVDPGV